MRKYRLKNKAFTLAEVLITLMLIGTIAALTIPDLYLKFEEAYFKTKLISTLSTLTEATRLMKNDYGGRLNGVLGYDGIGKSSPLADEEPCPARELSNPSNSTNPDDNIMEMYSRYLKWIKKYPAEAGRTGILRYKNRTTSSIYDQSDEPILVLIDGTTIAFTRSEVQAAEGTVRPLNSDKAYTKRLKYPVAEELYMDLNGSKGPNVYGRDVHNFDITVNMVTSWRLCKFDLALPDAIASCKINGDTCGALWVKGVSVY